MRRWVTVAVALILASGAVWAIVSFMDQSCFERLERAHESGQKALDLRC